MGGERRAMNQELAPQLQRIASVLDLNLAPQSIERLGGLTNRNFKVEAPAGRFVLRLAGQGTSDYIDRAVEEVNARVASQAGVNAEVLFFDRQDGTMLSRYVDESRTMSIESFRDEDAVQRAGRALHRLHSCGSQFQGQFELFEQIDRYLAILSDKRARLPDGYAEVQHKAEKVRQALARHPLPQAPCHCDPLVENFLDTGTFMHIIDFEYAGNNDPMWDLGDLSVEGHFTAAQDEQLLLGYFGSPPHPLDQARMVMYKAMCDLLWTLWGVLQHVNHNPAEDFWAYGVGRLERCRQLMASTQFNHHLAECARAFSR